MKRKITAEWNGVTLRPKQSEIISPLVCNPYYLLVWKMRSGKTYPLLIAADLIGGATLVVCPPAVLPVWKEAVVKLGIKVKVDVVSSGSLHKVQKESVYTTLIIDEIHQYRTYSNRFKALQKIRSKVKHCYGATGTPIDKDLHESFYMVQLLDKGELLGTNKQTFLEATCTPTVQGDRITWVLTEEHKEPFKRLLSKFVSTYFPEELEEPEVKYYRYPMTPVQERFIKETLAPIKKLSLIHI